MEIMANLKANLSEKLVTIRGAKLSFIEKLVNNFSIEIEKFDKKSEVFKMIGEGEHYPSPLFLNLRELWSRDSILEIFKSPGVSYEALNESKGMLRESLEYSKKDVSFDSPIPSLERDPVNFDKSSIDNVLESLDNLPWNEQFKLGYNMVALLSEAEIRFQKFLVRVSEDNWEQKAKQEVITLQEKSGGKKYAKYSSFKKEHYDYDDDECFFYYMYWNYIFLTSDDFFDAPDGDESDNEYYEGNEQQGGNLGSLAAGAFVGSEFSNSESEGLGEQNVAYASTSEEALMNSDVESGGSEPDSGSSLDNLGSFS